MFELDGFVESCTAALAEVDPRAAIRDLLARAVSAPSELEAALPPERAELVPLFSSQELTIVKVVWAPSMVLPPHDHRMWALIGIYGGSEDNTFYRRSAEGIVASGEKRLVTSEVTSLGSNTIHSVTNPMDKQYTGAIHIYGGDFMNKARSMWDPDTMEEHRADGDTVRRLFEEANTVPMA